MIKQLRFHHYGSRIKNSLLGRALILGAFLLSLMLSSPARAESDLLNNFWGGINQINFNQSGASFIPLNVVQPMSNGDISPLLQYVALNKLLNKAIKDAMAKTPAPRDPYVVAKQKWDFGICQLTQTYKTMQVMVMLPQMSNQKQNGGSNDVAIRQAALTQALALAQAMAGSKGCDPNSNDSGFDSQFLNFLQGIRI